MRHPISSLLILKQLLFSLFKFDLFLTIYSFLLITLKSLSVGATFLMIIPLLQFAGSSDPLKNQPSYSWLHDLFNFFHLHETLSAMLGFFTAVMCLSAALAYLEQQAVTRLQQRYNQYLRTRLQRSLLSSSWSFLRSQKKSDLIHLLITETQNLAICNHQLLMLINQLFLIAVNTLLAFYLSWKLTLFVTGCAVLLFGWMLPLHRKIVKTSEKYLNTNQDLHQTISQQLYGIKSIKGSGFELLSVDTFEKTGSKLEKLATKLHMTVARNHFFNTINSAIVFSLLLYFAIQVLAMPFQQLMIVLIIYSRILPLLSSSQQTYQRILHQVPAHEHIMKLLDETQKHQEIIDDSRVMPFEQKIEVEGVSFKYPQSNRWIIQDIHFQLKKNTSILVMGHSGVGKTTLVDLICGLSSPTKGKILIDGELITSKNAHAWRKQIAYITQDVFLFNATLRENLLWFDDACSESDLYYALELASAEFVYQLPDKLDTLIGDKGVVLSGGERQRIALARAILQKPKLLILDEGTNSLDPERVAHIHHSLAVLKGMMTILIISHQPVDMKMIDQVIHLEDKPISIVQ